MELGKDDHSFRCLVRGLSMLVHRPFYPTKLPDWPDSFTQQYYIEYEIKEDFFNIKGQISIWVMADHRNDRVVVGEGFHTNPIIIMDGLSRVKRKFEHPVNLLAEITAAYIFLYVENIYDEPPLHYEI